jgi:LysM repeat protein
VKNTGTPPKGNAGGGGKLGFLKDKRVLIGLAAAGGVGLVVLLKNGGGAGAGSAADSGGSSMSPANYDSSSYDVGAQINDAFNGISDDLRGFSDTLTDIQTQLGQVNGPSSGTTTPPPASGGTTPPISKPKPKPVLGKPVSKPPAAQYTYTTKFTSASAARGSNWGSTLSTIAQHYHTSVSTLLKLNPSIHNANKIGVHQKIRVK